MLDRISSRELTEWIAFYQLEPFGSDAANFYGAAIIASVIANVNRAKGQKAYTPEDFMPKFEKNSQSVDEMLQIASMVTAVHGGQDLRDQEAEDG